MFKVKISLLDKSLHYTVYDIDKTYNVRKELGDTKFLV